MKLIANENNLHLIRLDKGEEVLKKLSTYAVEHGVTSGVFTALGACKKVSLAYYDLENKKYLDKTFSEDLEITGVTGNIARMDGSVIIHAHGTFSGKDYQVIGGHIKELIVSATCEVHLTVIKKGVERDFNETTGLNLLR